MLPVFLDLYMTLPKYWMRKISLMQHFWITVSKAFDSVSFNCLLRELFAVGVRGNLLSWFRSYLTDRLHRTVIDG